MTPPADDGLDVQSIFVDGVEFIRRIEDDTSWMQRVYPDHAWTPDDGIPYPVFCQRARADWEAKHSELYNLVGRARGFLREALEHESAVPQMNWDFVRDWLAEAKAAMETGPRAVATPGEVECNLSDRGMR